jgi:hypothetical protein
MRFPNVEHDIAPKDARSRSCLGPLTTCAVQVMTPWGPPDRNGIQTFWRGLEWQQVPADERADYEDICVKKRFLL